MIWDSNENNNKIFLTACTLVDILHKRHILEGCTLSIQFVSVVRIHPYSMSARECEAFQTGNLVDLLQNTHTHTKKKKID